jgi:phosphatidylglycerol:prolipoprotein diacylglycerol transferase
VLATISIGINPVAFSIGSLSVHWYGILYVVAFVVAYYLGARAHLRSRGITDDNLLEGLAGWTILFGLIGARLYYDVQNLDMMHSFVDVIAVWNGGMAFYGAIIAGVATVIVVGRRWHLPVWTLLDGAAFFAVVGQPIGRIGNIINGDILGGPSNLPWATAYTNSAAVLQPGFRLGVAYQPAGAYEALATLVILGILLAIRRRGVRPGVLIISYVALYSVSQFLLDFVRQSEPVVWLGLRELALTAIISLVVLVPLMIVVWRRTEGRARPEPAAAAGSAPPAGAAPSADAGPAADAEPAAPAEPTADTEPTAQAEPTADAGPVADAAPATDAEEAATS